MKLSFTDLPSILQSVPGGAYWLGLVIVLLPLLVALRYSNWGKRIRPAALPAVFLLVTGCTIVLNISLLGWPGNDRAWKQFRPARTTLFARSLELPLNGYAYGNEPLMFLNEYLGGRTLIVAREAHRGRIWDNNGSGLVSAQTGKELILAEILFADYDDLLTRSQADSLLRRPTYGVGIPKKNHAIFVMGEDRPRSSEVLVFTDDTRFFLIPGPLARKIADIKGAAAEEE